MDEEAVGVHSSGLCGRTVANRRQTAFPNLKQTHYLIKIYSKPNQSITRFPCVVELKYRIGARTLLGAPGLTTRSKDATKEQGRF